MPEFSSTRNVTVPSPEETNELALNQSVASAETCHDHDALDETRTDTVDAAAAGNHSPDDKDNVTGAF